MKGTKKKKKEIEFECQFLGISGRSWLKADQVTSVA